MNEPSKTPRTDAFAQIPSEPQETWAIGRDWAVFARMLERDLSAMRTLLTLERETSERNKVRMARVVELEAEIERQKGALSEGKREWELMESMDNAAMDKMQAMIREQSESLVALGEYAEALRVALGGARFGLLWIAHNTDEALPEWARQIATEKLAQADAALAKNPNLPAKAESQPEKICPSTGTPSGSNPGPVGNGMPQAVLEIGTGWIEHTDSDGKVKREPTTAEGAEFLRQAEEGHAVGNLDALNELSKRHGEVFDLAVEFRDTLCRTLDKAEIYGRQGKPLPQDEIDAMTARLADTTERLYGPGRQVPPHRSGGGQIIPSQGLLQPDDPPNPDRAVRRYGIDYTD